MKKWRVVYGIFGIAVTFMGAWIWRNNTEVVPVSEVTREETIVGVVMHGQIDDDGWTQSHYESLENVKEELNLNLIYRTNTKSEEKAEQVIEELIDRGATIIIVTSYHLGDSIYKKAEEHPNICFLHAGGNKTRKNMVSYFGRMYQVRYLTGIVAGMQTDTNEIGYVAAMPVSQVIREINAFTLGVRSVNPNAFVHVEWMNSWNSDEVAANITIDLLNEYPIDVITYHHDSFETLRVAEEWGINSIGYNLDHSDIYKNTYLTGCVWNWDIFYRDQILKCLYGKFKGKSYWNGIETGLVDLVPLTKNTKQGISEVVEAQKSLLSERIWDVFDGPIIDQDGYTQVEDGFSISEDQMLHNFNWFVYGVDGTIPVEAP